MKTIRHHATLFYYDGPQVFEARDAIGGHYIAVLAEAEGQAARCLVAGVTPERLRDFRVGLVDLRRLLLDRPEESWFLSEAPAEFGQPITLVPQSGPLGQSPLLPDDGFVLHDAQTAAQSLAEARARNNLVLEIAVEPPEAAAEHRIRAGTLAGLLAHVQTMLKHAYGAALREMDLTARRLLDRTDAHLMDVIIPAAPGSFRIVLEAVKRPDLLGQNELARALVLIDEMFEDTTNPAATLARVKARRGHLAGAYMRLLRFLVNHRTGLRYAWAEPTSPTAHARVLAERDAQPLIDALAGVSNLTTENVSLVGALSKADVKSGTWRITTADGEESGHTKEGGPTLDGLKIGATYRFTCEEVLAEIDGSGRETRTLVLVEYEAL